MYLAICIVMYIFVYSYVYICRGVFNVYPFVVKGLLSLLFFFSRFQNRGTENFNNFFLLFSTT